MNIKNLAAASVVGAMALAPGAAFAQEAEVTASVATVGHSCSISVANFDLGLTQDSLSEATGSRAAAFNVSQNGPTTWDLDTVVDLQAPGPIDEGEITLEFGGIRLAADKSGGETDNVNSVLTDEGVDMSARILADGQFETGTYQIGSTLTCVSYDGNGGGGGGDED